MDDGWPVERMEVLTPETVREVFPIAPRDRKENADLFEPFVEGSLKDDQTFYAGLLRMLTGEGAAQIVAYDRRMARRRQLHKRFGQRIQRRLAGALAGLEPPGGRELEPDDLPLGSVERELFYVQVRLRQVAEGGGTPADADWIGEGAESQDGGPTGGEDDQALDWRAVAARMADALAALSSPDRDAVLRIRDLAEDLAEACAAATEKDHRERTEALRERLRIADPGFADRWPAEWTPERAEALEAAIVRLEAEAAALREVQAVRASLEAEARSAQESGDLDAEERLIASRRRARQEETERRSALDAARAALESLFQPETGAASTDGTAGRGLPAATDGSDEGIEGAAEDRTEEPPAQDPLPGHATAADQARAPGDLKPEAEQVPVGSAVDGIAQSAEGPEPGDVAPRSPHTPPEDDGTRPEPAPDRPEAPAADRAEAATPAAKAPAAAPSLGDGAPAGPAPEAGPPTTDAPAATTEEVDLRLGELLQQGDTALAWHLARLAEDEGIQPAVPAAVVEAAVLGPTLRRSEDMADARRLEVLAQAMGTLAQSRDADAAGLLLLAGLLRPALLDPDMGARGHVANLPRDGALAEHTALIDALGSLSHEIRPTMPGLAELAGAKPVSAVREAGEALSRWISETRSRQTAHVPTTRILQDELRDDGAIGQVVRAAVQGRPGAAETVRGFIDEWLCNRDRQEAFVADADRRTGRPKSGRIMGAALNWFCERLDELAQALGDWLEAQAAEAATTPDRQREALLRMVAVLRGAIERSRAATPPASGPLARAAHAVLLAAVDDLDCVLAGAAEPRRQSLRDVLEQPLLRLPGGCQTWAENDPAFAEERARADRRRLAGLLDAARLSLDEEAALVARIAESAVLPARRLLLGLQAERPEDPGLRAMEQRLAEAEAAARGQMRDRVERLRQSLATLGYLDLDFAEQLRSRLASLAAIAAALAVEPRADAVLLPARGGLRSAEVPPDFPELDEVLAEIEAERDRLLGAIRAQQRRALEALTAGLLGASARSLLGQLDELDPVTADDAIAELKAGREVPQGDIEAQDPFPCFFPGLVTAIDEADRAATSRGAVLRAIGARAAAGPLSFEGHDEDDARRARQFVETWATAEGAMREKGPARLTEAATGLWALLGFTGLRVADAREHVPAKMWSAVVRCDVPRAATWFLPPTFGSAAAGRYRLLMARDTPVEQALRHVGTEGPDEAWVLFHFGRLSVADRRALARQVRRDGRHLLVIDEALLLHLAALRGDRLEAFFGCTLPFSWTQPYSTNAGQIPPEVFFGRRDEMERVTRAASGGSVIYGGRQLGKSALLNHIRGERHQPKAGRIALYLDIKPVGGLSMEANRIWPELVHALGGAGVRIAPGSDAPSIVAQIRDWIAEDGGRRMIVMFDEADNFLRSDNAAGSPNLQRLLGLMRSTGWRFKAVFAGLHNVRRLAQAPNSTLPHLGDAICIGPMNQTKANRAELLRLAVEPMRAAGLDYATPSLASDMLARMNYYPSLVQVFGQQVVESLGRRIPAGRTGPRWTLDGRSLFEGEAAERIAAQIRQRFQLTLNLDTRYEVIAKSIALHRLSGAGGEAAVLSRGLTAEEVMRVTIWPERVVPPALPDLVELLDEMVDLGVLGSYPGGRYGLRNAQVAQMLGTRERLEEDLLNLSETEGEPAYDAAQVHGLLRPLRPSERSPLSDRALQALFNAGAPGLRCIAGPPELVGKALDSRIAAAAEIWLGPDHVRLVSADEKAIGRAVEEARATPTVLVIGGPWNAKTAALLASRPKVLSGEVLPVWCTDRPPDGSAARMVRAATWSDLMLRHWLAQEGLAPALDDPATRAEIMAASGGAPARLALLRPLLDEMAAASPEERRDRLRDWRARNPLRPEVLELSDEELALLRSIVDYEDVVDTAADLDAALGRPCRLLAERLVEVGCLTASPVPEGAPRLTPLGRLAVA